MDEYIDFKQGEPFANLLKACDGDVVLASQVLERLVSKATFYEVFEIIQDIQDDELVEKHSV